MPNSRHYKRLSLILSPSPSLSAVSHGQSWPEPRDSMPISHQEGPRSLPVKTPRQSLQPCPPSPTMHPLLSGPSTSDLPLIVFSHTCSGSGPLMSQSLRRRPHAPHGPHSQSRIPSERDKQATGPPKPKRRSPDLFLPSSTGPRERPRTLRSRSAVKHRASIDVTSATGWIMSADGDGQKQVTASPNRPSWTHKRGQASVGGGVWGREARLGSMEPLPEPLPEKQRVMNVRRAKKMQQVRFDYSSRLFFCYHGLEALIHPPTHYRFSARSYRPPFFRSHTQHPFQKKITTWTDSMTGPPCPPYFQQRQ